MIKYEFYYDYVFVFVFLLLSFNDGNFGWRFLFLNWIIGMVGMFIGIVEDVYIV